MKRGRVEKESHPSGLVFGEHVICKYCKGRGTRMNKTRDVCMACDGRGYVRIQEE